MPSQGAEVEIIDTLAVDVDVVIARETRSPLSHAALGSMTLIDEWRDDSEDRFRASHLMSARDLHRLTPALQNEKRPDARPSYPPWMLEKSLPYTLHGRRIQNARRTNAIGSECRFNFGRNSPASHSANGNENVRFGRPAISR